MPSRSEARAALSARRTSPLEMDGACFTVEEPEDELLQAAMSLPDFRMRSATIAAACLLLDGVPVFNGAWEVLRLPVSRSAPLRAKVMEIVLEWARPPAAPKPGVDVAAASPEEVLKSE